MGLITVSVRKRWGQMPAANSTQTRSHEASQQNGSVAHTGAQHAGSSQPALCGEKQLPAVGLHATGISGASTNSTSKRIDAFAAADDVAIKLASTFSGAVAGLSEAPSR